MSLSFTARFEFFIKTDRFIHKEVKDPDGCIQDSRFLHVISSGHLHNS